MRESIRERYNDVNWNTLSDDSKITSGYIFNIAGGSVSWKLKKYTILIQSTMESEMITIATASEKASLLRCSLSEIPVWEKPMATLLIHYNSMTTIVKIENHYYNGKIHQIRRKYNTITDCISRGAIRVDHVRTDENLADPLTKGLSREKVYNTSNKMGLMPI